MEKNRVQTGNETWECNSTPEDLKSVPETILTSILFNMQIVSSFENALMDLQKRELLWGPLHTSLGVEASASAAIAALEKRDRVNGTHRGHHHVVSKGFRYFIEPGWNPVEDEVPGELKAFLVQTLAEILGLKNGLCGGRGGSMHLYFPQAGIHGTNGIVGGGIPAAAGISFASRHFDKDEVMVTFFGDGASNQGSFHETANIAGAWGLPLVFFIENNHYAVGTSTSESCGIEDLALRGSGYGMPSRIVYGYDPVGTYLAMKEAVDYVRREKKPFLIESKCYRPIHHDSPLPGSRYGYRTEEEEKWWEERDAKKMFPESLLSVGILDSEQVEALSSRANGLIDECVAELLTENGSSIKDELWPDRSTALDGVRSDGGEFSGIAFSEGVREPVRERRFYEIIAEATGRWMEKDPSVVEWGEDVANFKQGPYGACKGLKKKFPLQVLNTPISESAFSGMALGAALTGIKPIVEIMFPDFVLVAADQLFNQIAKARHMYGDTGVDLPIIFRTRIATGTGMGPQHSMDPASLFAQFPGWRIVAPSSGYDYIGLFNTAMVSRDPVLILEHQLLYNEKFPVPEDWDYFIPFGKASVLRGGSDVTLVTWGGMAKKTLEVAERLGSENTSCEVLDLRTLDPVSMDYDAMVRSVRKTGRIAIVEESVKSQSLGSIISRELTERCWKELEAPPYTITSIDAPIPTSKVIEEAIILDEDDLYRRLKDWLS